MEFLRCFRCMEETHSYPCPCCGYAPGNDSSKEYALSPGTILNGRYVVGTTLGQGGFGITYVGWDLVLESKVAIKEYFPTGLVGRNSVSGKLHWYGTPQAENARDSGLEMSLKEARKMSRVRDIPQVVHVLDQFPENNTAYIVMDFVQGQTLKAYLDKKGPLTWEQTRTIFLPVIEAMEKAHDKGLIHRDLSPDNLMLLPDGSLKILDLGAAKDLNVNTGASSMQVAKGGFSPLEQYSQRGSSGPWTDVYALAATMYYSLTSVRPPNAVDRVDEDTIRWDFPQLAALPEGVLPVLKQALAVSSKARIQSMGEFAESLKKSGTIKAQPQAPKDIPKKESKKDPLPIAAIVAILTIVLVALLMILPKHSPELSTPEASDAIPETTVATTAPTEPEYPPTEDEIEKTEETDPTESADSTTSAFTQRYQTFSAGRRHTVALRTDGTVIAQGYTLNGQCDVQDWKNIVSISAGGLHTVGLKADGTAVAVGYNDDGQCNVSDWSDLVNVSAGHHHTVGLKADGTVVAVGANNYNQCDVSGWTDIVAISAGWDHTVALKSDGTVVATGNYIKVGAWSNIVAISSGYNFTIGLKADGTVVSVGRNNKKQGEVSNWRDIVAIGTGYEYTIGLKSDGTVVCAGSGCNAGGLRDTRSLRNIIAIAAGSSHVVAMKQDGSFVSFGDNDLGQCEVTDWTDIRIPDLPRKGETTSPAETDDSIEAEAAGPSTSANEGSASTGGSSSGNRGSGNEPSTPDNNPGSTEGGDWDWHDPGGDSQAEDSIAENGVGG